MALIKEQKKAAAGAIWRGMLAILKGVRAFISIGPVKSINR